MEGMNDQKYSNLGRSDERLEILKVSWKRWKIRITKDYVEKMQNQQYTSLTGRDERLKILQKIWKVWRNKDTQGLVEVL